jgi:hypothetical protein
MPKVSSVDPADVQYMRQQFSPAVERGATKAELDVIRVELRTKYQGVYSVPQVDAVCSQVIIQRNRLLTAVGTLPAAPSVEVCIATGSLDASPERVVIPLASGSDPLIECELRTADTCLSEPPPLSVVTSHGEQYRNPTKERWFREWLTGILASTTPEWRAEARVLTLAGPLCLRLPEYIKAGFRPEHIVAVEGGSDDERALFQRHCPPGVQQRLMRLEDFLSTEPTRFGVVEADFVGFMQSDYLDIIANLPLAERAFVLVNVMGRRENEDAKWLLQFAQDDMHTRRTLHRASVMQQTMIEAGRIRTRERMEQAYARSMKAAEVRVGEHESVELFEARMNALSVLFTRNVGRNRIDLSPYAGSLERMRSSLTDRMGETANGPIIASEIHLNVIGLSHLLNNHMRKHGLFSMRWPKDLGCMIGMNVRSMLHAPLVASLRKIKYLSEKHSTPYYTLIMELLSPKPLLNVCPDAAGFLATVNERSCLATTRADRSGGEPPYTLVNHLLNPLTAVMRGGRRAQVPIGRGDKLNVCIDGLSVAKVSAGQFFAQLDAYEDAIWKGWPLVDEKKQAEIPWEDITVRS